MKEEVVVEVPVERDPDKCPNCGDECVLVYRDYRQCNHCGYADLG